MDIEKVILKKIYFLEKWVPLSPAEDYLVAFSGGIDSLVLTKILPLIVSPQRLTIIHIYPQTPHPAMAEWEKRIQDWGYKNIILEKHRLWEGEDCYQCARFRRRQIFEAAQKLGIKNIILGHTGSDLIETYLLNLLFHSRGESLPLLQKFFSEYYVYRPLLGVLKDDIFKYAGIYHLNPFQYPCKGSLVNRRQKVRDFLLQMGQVARKNILRFVLEKEAEKLEKIQQ